MKKIYLFDFDGTIYKGDSFIHFTFFSQSLFSFVGFWTKALISIIKGESLAKIKESFFMNFKGMKSRCFQKICNEFAEKKLVGKIKSSFMDYIDELEDSSEIVIVTASIENYIKPWCIKNRFKLIGTQLEYERDLITGRFKTPNCKGDEKVIRIANIYDLSKFDQVIAFGDTKSDLPMLNLSDKSFYKHFK